MKLQQGKQAVKDGQILPGGVFSWMFHLEFVADAPDSGDGPVLVILDFSRSRLIWTSTVRVSPMYS